MTNQPTITNDQIVALRTKAIAVGNEATALIATIALFTNPGELHPLPGGGRANSTWCRAECARLFALEPPAVTAPVGGHRHGIWNLAASRGTVSRSTDGASVVEVALDGGHVRKVYARTDGSVRIVDVCACGARRSLEIDADGTQYGSDWTRLESEMSS